MKTTNSVILSETKNLMLSMKYETLHSVQGDNFETFARASIDSNYICNPENTPMNYKT